LFDHEGGAGFEHPVVLQEGPARVVIERHLHRENGLARLLRADDKL
jgi:hypothetical protein